MTELVEPDLHTWNYRLDLEYDGSDFSGWQYQDQQRTVQGELESAISILFPTHSRVSSAGRTDAGVHATGQVASFQSPHFRPVEQLHQALNNHLPGDIRVLRCELAASDFHARFSARWRGYEYTIAKRPRAIGRNYAWHCRHPLNIQKMNAAASEIIGAHDFSSFSHFNPLEKHYLSDVFLAQWSEDVIYYKFNIQANRFLHGMVRLLVGTFVSIGREKIVPEGLKDILAARDNRKSGQKVPSSGLVLTKVGYRDWPLE